MLNDPSKKYQPISGVALNDRQWPYRVIAKPPIWCSVDLRDGNQALIEPMDSARKNRMFEKLVAIGFKEIEVGFPSASQLDYDFCRELVDDKRVPEDVTVQVLVQAREDLMRRTFDSLKGIHRAIVHVYNSTSVVQRKVVFGIGKDGIKDIAVNGARLLQRYAREYPETEWIFQYSPESFTGTEIDYAVEVCEAVLDVWQPTAAKPAIINLPATVEMTTPNVYADQIEWVSRNIKGRDSIVLSVHPHNDRGTAVAAAELGLMAGADRVEGTLFGNGERTGNVDIVTMALNMYTQGVNPQLSLAEINDVIECAESCNRLPVHPRHPYAGQLVFTAFSGSHQDAIKKGFAAQGENAPWEMPYLPIDPKDIGRTYEAIIRVNSQSGKGGVAYLLERDYGIKLPRPLQVDFSRVIQKISDATGGEITSAEIWQTFKSEYIDQQSPFACHHYTEDADAETDHLTVTVSDAGEDHVISGGGNGPIDAFTDAFQKEFGITLQIVDYQEHAVGGGAGATAVSFVEIRTDGSPSVFGVGMHRNIVAASLNAIVSAVNRAVRQGTLVHASSRKAEKAQIASEG
jgi:2-isopropylmalate synthase